VSVGDRV